MLRNVFALLIALPVVAACPHAWAAEARTASAAPVAKAAAMPAPAASNASLTPVQSEKNLAQSEKNLVESEKSPEPQKGLDSGLPVPRFVSLGADKVNARTGPGSRYPIAWQYQRRGLPVEVVAEYEYWRRIRDRDGTETWVHKNLTSGKRYALVDGTVRELLKKPDPNSDVLLTAEPGVQARLRKCDPSWCQVEIAGSRGWIPRNHLWGLYPSETFE
ncbi:SH3 domain-containing protein [Ferrovibrio sp.]|uniref:SH3 domain-containing protein n=1 Tax=Ferrovibrio sp. TaxID=1917215 RepID=UPI0025BC7588|nr:SH3 domain-containing protein [Ferrovibrio sp.]